MNDDLTTAERKGRSRKVVHAKSAYESEELREQYVRLTEKAQDLYLAKDFKGAKRCALMAMRIRPTSHLFGLCAALAEAVGNFNEAADFRLLQAFQANDVELWRELLNEFLENNLWFKATVCLKRLSALAPPRSKERHDIQLQLADLLVALGEHRPATNIYRNLWVQSEMKDFEVFATLSSLLFQLGRWNALDELLRESTTVFLKKEIAKQISKDAADRAPHDNDHYAEDDGDDEGIMLGMKRSRDKKEKSSAAGTAGISSGVIDALLKGSGVTAEELRKKSAAAAGSASASSSSGEPQSKIGLRIEGIGMKGGEIGRDPNDVDANNFDSFDDLFGENGDYLLSGGDRRDEVFLGGSGVSTTTSANLLTQGGADNSSIVTGGYEDASGLVPDRSAFDDHLADNAAVSAVALAGTGAANNDMDFDFTGTGGGGGGGQSIDVLSRPSTASVNDPFIELTSPEDIRNYLSLINVHTELLNERGQFSSTVQLILLAASHLRMAVLDMNADILLKLAIAYAHMGSLSAAEEVVRRLVDTCSPNDYGDVLFDAAETLSKLGAFTLSSTIYRYLLRFSRMTDENSVLMSATPDGAGDGATAPTVVGLSSRYALRKGETLDMLRDRLDRDVALLFGIARCEANSESFTPYQWHLVHGLPTPPILSPTGFGPGSGGSSAFPSSAASAPSQAQQAYALARKHPAIAALLEIHEQLDPFHVPTRLLLSQLFRHEFRNYEAAEKVLLPPKALFSPEAFSKSSASSSSLFVDPSKAGSGPQSLGNLSAMMAQFALNNDPSLLRESGLQRTQCDAELLLVYNDLGPRRALSLLKCGVPFFDRLLTTAAGDDEDAESVIAGGKKSRAPSLSLPGLSRASSAIVPASRVAGSLSGDNGPATSSMLSTTRSIATSARSSAAGGKLMLRTRGVSAGSSYITSSATTALTVAGSRVGPASSVAEMLEAKDSTGIFRFHRTSAAMRKAVVGSGRGAGGGGGGGGGGGKTATKDIASVGKRIRKTVNKMDLQNGSAPGGEGGDGGAGAGGVRDAADLLMEIAGDNQKTTSAKKGSANQSRRYEHMKASRAKVGGPQSNAVIATRSEILAHEVPYHAQKSNKGGWEVSSVGNLGDIAFMEDVMGDDHFNNDQEEEEDDTDRTENTTTRHSHDDDGDDGDESATNDNATDQDGFLLPSSAGPKKGGSSGSQKGNKKAVAEVDDAIPSIDDVIAQNFAADPMMAELFRSVTEGSKKGAGSDPSQPNAPDTFGDHDAPPPHHQTVEAKVEAQTFSSPLTTATTAATGKGKAPAPGGKKGAKTVATAPAAAPPPPAPTPAPAPAPVTSSLPVSQPIPASTHDKRPVAHEYVRLFGRSRLIRLALLMMDAYSHLGDHVESKNFGVFFILRMKDFFRRGGELATPIRLAVLRQSLLSGDVTSAVSNTLTILRLEGRIEDPSKSLFGAGRGSGAAGAAGGGDDNTASSSTGSALSSSVGAAAASGLLVGTVHQRHLWETFAVLVNRGLKTRILNRLVTDKGRRDFEIMCIIGNTHYNAGTYLLALRFYMIALEQRPRDPLLLFLIGICYLQQSTRRTDVRKNSNIQNAFYFLQEYYQVVASDTPSCIPEATYNIARAYHFLSLYYLAEPLYMRTITMLEQEGVGRFHSVSAAAAAEAEPSPFAPSGGNDAIAKRRSGGVEGSNVDMASSFYGFISAKDDEAPQIDSSIRKGFGLHEGMTPAMRMREHHLRQEMLLQASRFNLSLIYKKSGPSDMIPLKTMTSVLY